MQDPMQDPGSGMEAGDPHENEETPSVEDLEALDCMIERYLHDKGALMPVLQEINATYNYLPEGMLRYVARRLNIPLVQVFHVATFYNVFSLEPRGEHLIRVCVGTACHVRGSNRLLTGLKSSIGVEPGETTGDRKFTLETVRCLGCCALSPCMVIDAKTHARLRPDALPKLLSSGDEG